MGRAPTRRRSSRRSGPAAEPAAARTTGARNRRRRNGGRNRHGRQRRGGTSGVDGTGTGTNGVTGGGGDTGANAAPAGGNGGATDVGVTADSITVANISILTGPVPGLFAGAPKGVQAYFAYQNSQGGVFGRQLKVEQQDDQFDCGINKALAEDDVNKYFTFVGSFSLFDGCSGEVIEAHPEIPDIHVPLSSARRRCRTTSRRSPCAQAEAPDRSSTSRTSTRTRSRRSAASSATSTRPRPGGTTPSS